MSLFDQSDIDAIHSDGAKPAPSGGLFDSSMISDVDQASQSQAQPTKNNANEEHPSTLTQLGRSAASVADQLLNMPGAIAGQVSYAGGRALGLTPEEAQQTSSKIASYLPQDTIGKIAGIENTPEYQHEASRELMNMLGQAANKYVVQPISNATGLPQEDVGNIAQSLSYAAVPAASKISGKVLGAAADRIGPVLEDTAAQDMIRQPTPMEQVRATYNQPNIENIAPYQSAGAAGTSVIGRIATASPDFNIDALEQLKAAQAKYGEAWTDHVDWNALDKQLNADSLPIPGRLTKGQASGDGFQISNEWNNRDHNGLGPVFDAQNQNQIDNLKAIRDQAAPDVNTTSNAEHADTLINAYKDLHKQDSSIVDNLWDQIRAKSSDQTIFDAAKIMQDAQAALKAKKLTAYDPGGQLKELMDDIQRGGMSADGYVAWRQNLGREAMAGGNNGAAASAILDAVSKSDLLPEAAQYRDMVNEALSAGRALHSKIKADPAYQAVVNGSASSKNFVNNFVIQGKPEALAQMANNLGSNDVALQTMRASVIDRLRSAAALDDQYNGGFKSAGFNKALDAVTPNARVIFNNGELQTLRSLGDYSKAISATPRSSFKNFSNTETAAHAPAYEAARSVGKVIATGAEAALAHKTMGASIPLVEGLKAFTRGHKEKKLALQQQQEAAEFLHESTRPAAGIVK